ncbi:DJ-1/PfpI family protein [Lishizhenia tianjinensis]|uniref:DJ-1/PfpI family protein n=1 Tax=Lishizhenia tianjinensis TaxID=477690 RepID=A0A1I7BNR7_9FLAO|nr:DJ-1/PfpI family protein [Lishizhenia tianjinensis]SFT88778.1 DJ-1/PfpI family protein [Lishizhenia tianjinensis]
MKTILITLGVAILFGSCKQENTPSSIETQSKVLTDGLINTELPTIGLLIFEGVLQSEVVATSDVFSKTNFSGSKLFNVVTISETLSPIKTEEGLHFVPDFNYDNCPELDVLFVPSGYDMYGQVNNKETITFIQRKNKEVDHVVSNCAGAQLIGKSGIADGHKIVTWIGGGKDLQNDYPNLLVQNDSLVSFVEDGRFSSSNGNLASYISALNLLEKMTDSAHVEFVKSYLYLDRLQDWEN